MSETKKEEDVKEFKPNPIAVNAKLNKVYASAILNSGKPNHNPHIWLRDNYQKLADAVAKGPITKDLEAAVMALPDNPDTSVKK